MSKVSTSFENNEFSLEVDTNEDGQKVLDCKLSLAEGIQEILKRGEKVEGIKAVAVEFSLAGLKIILDTDKDGEKLGEINIYLTEALDEVGLVKN